MSLWCQGLNQSSSGTAKNTALINLHLATGQIGRPGAGPLSLTGQPNAMGGREVGGLANLLSAHRDLANPAHRAEVARLWGVDVGARAARARPRSQLFEAAARGEIKALWIACTNPAQSMPDQALVRAALERCELVVLQEAFAHTATARYADVLLPASTWAEKDGTVTNSERRISRVRAAIAPPGEARDDWRIVADFARRLQARLQPELHDLFPYDSSEAVWNEHRESTRGRDLDITGLSYALLEARGRSSGRHPRPPRWATRRRRSASDTLLRRRPARSPVPSRQQLDPPERDLRTAPASAALGRARLYTDGRFATADGRARFIAAPTARRPSRRDPRHPFALNTGRLRDQWHGMSRSGTVARLFGHEGSPAVRVHPRRPGAARPEGRRPGRGALAARRDRAAAGRRRPHRPRAGLRRDALGRRVRLRPRRRRRAARRHQRADDEGALPRFAAARAEARGRVDQDRRAAVAPHRGGLAAGRPGGRGARTHARGDGVVRLRRLRAGRRPRRPHRDLAAGGFGNADRRIAGSTRSPAGSACGRRPPCATPTRCAARAACSRSTVKARRRASAALLLVGEAPAADWLRGLWQDQLEVAPFGRFLLAPQASSPQGLAPRSPQVCNCFDVSEQRIRACLAELGGAPAERIGALQARLKCGTQCGSCLPELRRLEHAVAAPAEVAPA